MVTAGFVIKGRTLTQTNFNNKNLALRVANSMTKSNVGFDNQSNENSFKKPVQQNPNQRVDSASDSTTITFEKSSTNNVYPKKRLSEAKAKASFYNQSIIR